MGGTFVAEELPESRRKMAAGLMHTGYYVEFFWRPSLITLSERAMVGGRCFWWAERRHYSSVSFATE